MKLNSRDGKPSYISKSVMKVYRRNRAETAKLCEQLDRLDKCKVRSLNNIAENIRSLRRTSRKIKDVIKEMDISEMRRRLIADQGYTITEEKINIAELIERVDSAIQNPIGRPLAIQFSQTVKIYDENSNEETNKLNDKTKDIDEIRTENKANDKKLPFQFRKITPPLKGRRMEEVYREMKEEGQRMMKVEELADFRRRSKDSQITKAKLKKLDKNRVESRNDDCQNPNEISKLKESFEHLLASKTQLHYNSETSDAKIGNEKVPTTASDKGHSKMTQINNQVEKITKEEQIPKPVRPMSCPPKSSASSSKEASRIKKIANSDNIPDQNQIKRCWDEHESVKMKAESKISSKQTKTKEKIRPKSCINPIPNERVGIQRRPVSQSKHFGSQVTEGNKGAQNPRYGNELKIDKELVYDARPKDAMTSGYATLRMTIGRRTTGLCVPKFKRILAENEITEKQRTCKYEMEKRRIQRVRKQLELEQYDV